MEGDARQIASVADDSANSRSFCVLWRFSSEVVGATGFEPATPCAQGERTHTTGGSGRPLPLVFLSNFAIWGNCRKPRAATDCQPIVIQRLIEDRLPKARPSHQILICSRLPSRLQFTSERWYGHGFRSSLE